MPKAKEAKEDPVPLKIRVKPEGRIFAGGAILKNVGSRSADLLVLSDSPVLRDGYLNNLDKKNSDVSNVYFLLQMIYLFQGKGQPLDNLVIDTIRNFSKIYPELVEKAAQIILHLEAGEAFKALKIGHGLMTEEECTTGSATAAF